MKSLRSASAPPPEDMCCVRASITISAPVDKIWDTLLDFPAYAEWNPFIRSQVLVDAHGTPLPSQTPTEGARIAQQIHLPSLSLVTDSKISLQPSTNNSAEVLTHVDPRAHILVWRLASPAPWLFWSERWHVLSIPAPSPDQETEAKVGSEQAADFWRGTRRAGYSEQQTVYETWEVLGGLLAPAVGWFVRARMERGFEESARALKERVEKRAEWTWG